MKIALIGALPASLVTFRGMLIKAMVSAGHDVFCLASGATEREKLAVESFGATYVDYSVARNGLNPLNDIATLCELLKFFKVEKPDVVLSYTIKPIIWGGIAARLAGVRKFYALVTGLGYAFQKGGVKRNILTSVVTFLYRLALGTSKGVIFQNKDNLGTFVDQKIVPLKLCHIVNGSGVDLAHFNQSPLPTNFEFLLIARLLGDKGIREYYQAAKIVKKRFPEATFKLIGPTDPSPDGIKKEEVNSWNSSVMTYLGSFDDVRMPLNNCFVYVLPSYHEGIPRTVLEAMSVGRPILTTDVPGCKETVVQGENGWLVQKQSAEALSDKMIWFINNRQKSEDMGKSSRRICEDKYDVHKVNKELMQIMGI